MKKNFIPSLKSLLNKLTGVSTDKDNLAEIIDDVDDQYEGSGGGLTATTYAELKALRDNKQLTPGAQYRIIDYICTVANDEEARAVSHPFDIIVTADNESTLNENARACLHEGDTYYSAEDCRANLSAWELKYSIDNDDTKYYWADTENGKGVIYWLKDDWGNECPYDFKQIQFKRYKITACDKSPSLVGMWAAKNKSNEITIDEEDYIWCYTFSWMTENLEIEDISVKQYAYTTDEYYYAFTYGNIIHDFYNQYTEGEINSTLYLNNIIFLSSYGFDRFYYGCCYNMFSSYCNNNTFGNNCHSNIFGNKCYSNTFGDCCSSNVFGNECYFNAFGNECSSNTFCNNFYSNIFGNECNFNTFGNGCGDNTFGNRYYSNTFSNECCSNTFGDDCNNNTFGDGCRSNTFGNNCNTNTLCNKTFNITASAYCYYCTFNNGVQHINLINNSATNKNRIQNYHILNGTQGADNNKITINASLGLSYCTYVGKNSSGAVKTWVPADLVQ